MESKLRIIAGKWRSRQLAFEESLGLRPTPARTRETLFNWLQQDVARSQCLDLFAGSGALGFEAASRGADSVTMVEENANACRLIKQNIDKLSAQQVNIVKSDVFKFLVADASPFNLVFLDPPFTQGL
ncbi:MAG: 16S rRNA (guanine(966)-N(2))-methyltransferase RsmD, partial [Cycloclasticus sp. symbiont of Poecilosclerida sp. N]